MTENTHNLSLQDKPIIGMSLDTGNMAKQGGYSCYPWYAIRKNYCDHIVAAGGIPILLPYYPDMVDRYSDLIDGFLIPGGDFDIPPTYYGEDEIHERVTINPPRTEFELALARAIKEQEKPMFGICGGMQLMNVAFGGTLIQHIPDEIQDGIAHEQPNPRCEAGHQIKILENTSLYALAEQKFLHPVNSAHHQAIRKVAPGFQVNAFADDGVIEGIEYVFEEGTPGFLVGVQWHPEFNISPLDCRLFDAFIQEAHRRKNKS